MRLHANALEGREHGCRRAQQRLSALPLTSYTSRSHPWKEYDVMSGSDPRLARLSESDSILSELSARQYLDPHRPLDVVLAEAQRQLGFCPAAAAAAVQWLGLDGARAVGRLRRAELIQLA